MARKRAVILAGAWLAAATAVVMVIVWPWPNDGIHQLAAFGLFSLAVVPVNVANVVADVRARKVT